MQDKNFNKCSVINHVPCQHCSFIQSHRLIFFAFFYYNDAKFLVSWVLRCMYLSSVFFDYSRFIGLPFYEDEWLHRGRRQVSEKFEFKSDANYRCPFKIPYFFKTIEEICEFSFHNLKIMYILIRYKLTFGQLSCF